MLIKHHLGSALSARIDALKHEGALPADCPTPTLTPPHQPEHGDYATPVAMGIAKMAKQNPRQIAERILAGWTLPEGVSAEIAGAGFINFRLSDSTRYQEWCQILTLGPQYGQSQMGKGHKVHIEYVSANPNGPLHVGHGRSAAFGSALVKLLKAAGFEVHNEYYVNDAGRQMNILTASVFLRYLSILGETVSLPEGAYQGDYVIAIAEQLVQAFGNQYQQDPTKLLADLPAEPDEAIDQIIQRIREHLGEAIFQRFFETALHAMRQDIQSDLAEFRVTYQQYFSEKSLYTDGLVKKALDELDQKGLLYTQNGATWFASTRFGDDKDRVVIRENGEPTYFASDIAYHRDKLSKGFDIIVDVLGADHHGYIARLKAAIQAFGHDPACLKTPLVQFAILYRGQTRVQMSTRSGSFVTLRALREEVGVDATRFFYLMRKAEQHLDFDMELAKSQSQDNPVYYVQYAHARIQRVLEEAQKQGRTWAPVPRFQAWCTLNTPEEQALMHLLLKYPEIIEDSAQTLEVHRITQYVRDVARVFHSYYNACPFIVPEADLFDARISLIRSTAQVLQNALSVLGISAPDKM